MAKIRYGSLFSGAGGLDVAIADVFDAVPVWHSEINPAAAKVLKQHWPEVPNLGDISQIDWSEVERVDILCGGFPCQDISAAGRQAGMGEGTRSGLWSEFARAIRELRPRIVVIENVRNLLSVEANRTVEHDETGVGDGSSRPVLRAIGAVLGDLCDLGYDAQWVTVAASDVGAPHRRERVFILATDTTRDGRTRLNDSGAPACGGRERLAGGSAGRAPASVALLPTPRRSDGDGGANPLSRAERMDDVETRLIRLVICPACPHHRHFGAECPHCYCVCAPGRGDYPDLGQWGKYAPAIHRWEGLTRPAPSPTEPNTKGKPRLAAIFSEWMQGFDSGWITAVPGISRNDQLRIIGNSVCPQQASFALRRLLSVASAL